MRVAVERAIYGDLFPIFPKQGTGTTKRPRCKEGNRAMALLVTKSRNRLAGSPLSAHGCGGPATIRTYRQFALSFAIQPDHIRHSKKAEWSTYPRCRVSALDLSQGSSPFPGLSIPLRHQQAHLTSTVRQSPLPALWPVQSSQTSVVYPIFSLAALFDHCTL